MTTVVKSYAPAGVLPSVPKYQSVRALLKSATMSGVGSSWRPARLFAIASTYHVSAWGRR
ncbi:hypothetical protein BH24ACT12_BH24ACT12_23520 [soil metagenome]